MELNKQRKTDRRTIYTVNTIKDALLELMEKQSFDKITVSSLCRQAEMTRTTFYLHFLNLTDVVDALLKDVLQLGQDKMQQEKKETQDKLIESKAIVYDQFYPIWQRILSVPKYRILFLDETLSNYILNKIYQLEKVKVVPILMEKGTLSKEEAELIFRFMLYGQFAVNKELGWQKDKRWYKLQKILTGFIKEGLKDLK